MSPLLEISHLEVSFARGDGSSVPVVSGVDLAIDQGEVVALVGESGSGKSQTAAAVLGMTPPGGTASGQIHFRGTNLLELDRRQWQDVRGRRIALVPQESLGALNPRMRVGAQISESLEAHMRMQRDAAWQHSVELLGRLGIRDPERVARSFPHQLSGGMRQRATLAIALCCDPDLVLADEPTTALDAITRRNVLALLATAVRERDAALILITHDLVETRRVADRVAVMYAGQIVESAPAGALFATPRHPYTRGLIGASLPLEAAHSTVPAIPGSPPGPGEIPFGCPFHPRCPHATTECRKQAPAVTEDSGRRSYRCFHPCD